MDTRSILTIGALCFACGASAQELRLSGGYNGSNVREAGEHRWVGRAGYQFGADILLGNTWFARAGAHLMVRNLNYALLTTDTNGVSVEGNTGFRYTSRSLRVPLHVGRFILDQRDDPTVNAYAFAGPTALFNLNARLEQDEFEVETAPVQWSIGFGGGAQYRFVFVEAGYDVAMSNIFEGDALSTDPRVNQVYAVAGVRLKLAE
ncbi:MAG: outer membrane beta-barrel protein [Flavobacteriales bacterium]|nr:MAG: outer membrane beta-barrel protein [Flavobacteriales bacterium]